MAIRPSQSHPVSILIRSARYLNPPKRVPSNFCRGAGVKRFGVRRSRSQFATSSSRHRGAVYRPWAFTEHGAIMAANVLYSRRAGQMSVYVVRAFVRLRAILATHKELDKKLAELERRVKSHDEHIQSLFEAIRHLMAPELPRPRRIGFRT